MPLAILILAAGKSTRMQSPTPKVLHNIAGLPILHHVLSTAQSLKPQRLAVIVGAGMDDVARSVAPVATIIQSPALGTGHAVQCSREFLSGFDGTILVIYGDTPFLNRDRLRQLTDSVASKDCAASVLGFYPDDPAAYGRLVTDKAGDLQAIVEFADAGAEQRAIGFCNAGIMAINGKHFASLIGQLDNKNAKGEYYLTDLIAIARKQGLVCKAIEAETHEVVGINTRAELAAAEAMMQDRLRAKIMESGVTLLDPSSVYFSHDTVIGADSVIEPNVFFGPGVDIGQSNTIKAFSHIEGAKTGANAAIGPFARLRPGTVLDEAVRVGNFVEIKNSHLQSGAKANHLTYLGDATVGARANIGAGTITCNYDGFNKHETKIGADAFIGSNSALVAPVEIGAGAIVGAGSVITQTVAEDALALSRAPQTSKPGWAKRFRNMIVGRKKSG